MSLENTIKAELAQVYDVIQTFRPVRDLVSFEIWHDTYHTVGQPIWTAVGKQIWETATNQFKKYKLGKYERL